MRKRRKRNRWSGREVNVGTSWPCGEQLNSKTLSEAHQGSKTSFSHWGELWEWGEKKKQKKSSNRLIQRTQKHHVISHRRDHSCASVDNHQRSPQLLQLLTFMCVYVCPPVCVWRYSAAEVGQRCSNSTKEKKWQQEKHNKILPAAQRGSRRICA